jgi:hypothetical protein
VDAHPGHTLVVYGASERADQALAALAARVAKAGGRITVVALALEERVKRYCCDTRSVFWNQVSRELAEDNLARARLAVEDVPGSELAILTHGGRRVAEVVVREAARRGADEILVADPRSCGLRRRDRRRVGGYRRSVAA